MLRTRAVAQPSPRRYVKPSDVVAKQVRQDALSPAGLKLRMQVKRIALSKLIDQIVAWKVKPTSANELRDLLREADVQAEMLNEAIGQYRKVGGV